MRFGFNIFLLAFVIAGNAISAPVLTASADNSQIYLNESFRLTLRIEGIDREPGQALFDANLKADYEYLGSSSDSRTFVQIINGRTVRDDRVARVAVYNVTPREAGQFQIHRITLPVGNTTLDTEGPRVSVLGATEQEWLAVSLEASSETVLVDEPFDVKVVVRMRALAEPNRHVDPFTENPPPRLEVPVLAQPVAKGLKGPDANEVLQSRLVRQRKQFGFAVNNFTVRNDPFSNPFSAMPFDMFAKPAAARFTLDRTQTNISGQAVWQYSLTLNYTPEMEGTYRFEPVSFKGQVITGVKAGGVPLLQNIFAVSPELTVRVIPPPEEGRPVSYIGAVGRSLQVLASLDAQTCRQGDPLTLAVDLSGDLNFAQVRMPPLSQIKNIADKFRVYDDNPRMEVLPDGRRFSLTLRPLQAGTIEFPALAFSFFNTQSRQYETVLTDPLPLRVEAVAQFEPDRIIDVDPASQNDSAIIRLRAARSVPAAITVADAGCIPDDPFFGLRHFIWFVAGPLLAACAFFIRWLRRHRKSWSRRRRRRTAFGRLVRRLRHSRALPETLQAVAIFFEERFDLPANAFAPADAVRMLEKSGAAADPLKQLRNLLQSVYDSSFQPGSVDDELLGQACTEFPELLRQCLSTIAEKNE